MAEKKKSGARRAARKAPEKKAVSGKKERRSPRKVTQDARKAVKEREIEKRFEDFGKEIEAWGRRMEGKGDEWDSWFHHTFGLVGPVLCSIFGIIIVALVSWVLGLVNLLFSSVFLTGIQGFLNANIAAFFLVFLFFSYSSYLSKASPRGYEPLGPFFSAIGITIGFWILAEVLIVANQSLGLPVIATVISVINLNLFWIFAAFLVIGYAFWGIRKAAGCPFCEWEKDKWCPECSREEMEKAKKTRTMPSRAVERAVSKPETGVRRLYRSGNDKILGGVCGGIAEYLGVDPVLVRLLWIIATLAWGFGVVAYIIAWIIIPRNPKHKWD